MKANGASMAKAGGNGLRGQDKQQADLRDVDSSLGEPNGDRPEGQRSSHQNEQRGADVRGQPPMVQDFEIMPEGLQRERKGPLDKNVGRGEQPSQVPKKP